MSDFVFSKTPPKKVFINVLTSLRFPAAFFIFLLHARNHGLYLYPSFNFLDLSKSVSFFFVLSGFVLSYSYHYSTINPLRFYFQRLLRIWPLHILSVIFVVLLLPRHLYLPAPVEFSDFSFLSVLLAHIFLIQSFFPIPAFFFGLNAVSWSISVEAFFYLLFPVFKKLRSSILVLISVFLSVLALFTAHRLSSASIQSFNSSALYQPVYQGFLYINPISRLPEFISGILFSRIYLSSVFQKICLNFHHILPKLFYDLILILFFSFTFFLGFVPPFQSGTLHLRIVLNQIISGFSFAAFILLVSSYKSVVIDFFEHRLFIFLGKISFAFYLFHQPIMIKAAQGGGLKFMGINVLPSNIFAIFSWSLALSIIVHLGFESLIVKKSRQLLS